MTPRMRILLLSMCIASAVAGTISANAQRTTRRGIKPPKVTNITTEAPEDTIMTPGDSIVILSGYDKPLRSHRETFFISNQSARPITSIRLTLNYLDISGRQLHNRTLTVPVEVPRGETRKVDIPSWDTQSTFYYHQSPPARITTRCYPFSVVCSIDYITHPSSCSDL